MADGENPLPADEDLFDQPPQLVSEAVNENPGPQAGLVNDVEPENQQLPQQNHDPSLGEQPSVQPVSAAQEPETAAAPQGIPFLDDPPPPAAVAVPVPLQPDQQENIYDQQDGRRGDGLFQPASYNVSNYVAPQPRSSDEYSDEANDGITESNSPEQPNDPSRLEANEQTVWIDSDTEHDSEDVILKQNFYLPYSDHNYDCADPLDRINHPREGPFPIIEGLDDDGNITKQYAAGEDPNSAQDGVNSPGTSSTMMVQDQHPIMQQQNQMPQRHIIHTGRPVGTAPPFSVGGTEYHAPRESMQRGIPNPNYRIANEYGNGLIPARGVQMGQRVVPTAAIIRGGRVEGHQNMYQSSPQQHPLGAVRAGNAMMQRRTMPLNQPAPGSYQHIQHPTPGVARRGGMANMGRMQPGIMGSRQAAVRPMQVARPMEVHDRDFADSLQPAQNSSAPLPPQPAPPPVQRRIADVAPHRMTQEQRQEQQQLVRSRPAAHFPIVEQQQQQTTGSPTTPIAQIVPGANRVGPGRLLVRGPQQPAIARGRVISGTEDPLRSPQRAPEQSPQQVESPQRKFQIKVTGSYSTPIPKVSDQLPAQLTEDSPEEPSAVVAEPAEKPEEVPPAQLLEEEREPSRHSSPVKPTPPHRLPQEEKSAHFARLMADKDKPVVVAPIREVPPSAAPLPLRPGHQEDTLAMVQSVFDSTKPRLPDTPKDKEAILKIADHLRFSAEKYETNKIPDVTRRRNDSAVSHGSQGHAAYQDAMERDDGRRKRQSLTRFDLQQQQQPGASSTIRQLPQQGAPHLQQQQQQQQQNSLEPPHRARGRPKGSTGPPRNRFGTDPVPPHRVGGARTLPPRQQAPSARNGGAAENSDSESEGIGEETWTMRCYCGMSHPTGLSLECEKCKTWQHTFCMGLKANSNTDGYMCELCLPRQLPISKAEAIRIQKKEIAKLKKTQKKEKEKKRKSEPPEPPKKAIASSSSRRSAPQAYQPEKKIQQLNDYSKAAALLLQSLPQTLGAEQLLIDARTHKKAKRMFVSADVEAFVATEAIPARAVVAEMVGHITMDHEVKRLHGNGGHIFLYDGLMKGTTGETMGENDEYIAIDTRKKGNDTKMTRRSCNANCVLKHVISEQATLGVMIVATRDIPDNQEVTLPFAYDFALSDVPLTCAVHMDNMHECLFEMKRKQSATIRARERHAAEEAARKQREEERAALEERRRLEDEVRRERAEMERKMDEEERLKKEEELAALEAKKKQEREEARKKKEEEKRAALKASEEVKEEVKEEARPTSSNSANEPHKLTREERLVQQAEERFRRQEEEEKRKEMMKAKAQEKAAKERESSKSKSPEPKPKEVKIELPEVSKAGESASSSSTASQKRVSGRNSKSVTADETLVSNRSETPRRSSKRHESIKSEPATSPPPKRSRTSTLKEETKKAATPKVSTPVTSKKSKNSTRPLKYKSITEQLHENAVESTKGDQFDFFPNTLILREREPMSAWVRAAKNNIGDDYKLMIKERSVRTARQSAIGKRKWVETEGERKEERREITRKTNEIVASFEQEKRETAEKRKRVEKRKNEEMISSPQNDKQIGDAAGPAPKAAALEEVREEQRQVTRSLEEAKDREQSETRESREGSESKEEDSKKSEKGSGPKKLTLDQYKQKRAGANKEEPKTSGTPTTSAAPRLGFIPSTDASSTANATLTTIFLDGFTATTPSAAPSTSEALSTRSKTREAGPSTSEEEPAAHAQSLADRAASVFGLAICPTAQQPASPPANNSPRAQEGSRVRQRSSRWN